MITAREALDLSAPTDDDVKLARKALGKIDKHLRKTMTFAGPEALELQSTEMSYAAAKVIAVIMKRAGWNVTAQLGVKQSELGGRSTIWQFLFSPVIEVYEEALADFDIDPPQLVA
jgi:hypothetical protein